MKRIWTILKCLRMAYVELGSEDQGSVTPRESFDDINDGGPPKN
jgi:hypothetical protein